MFHNFSLFMIFVQKVNVLIFSLFMIFVIWLFKKYMFFSQRLILYLSIAALCDSVAYMMGSIENAAGCKFQVT